jgi:phenylalanyl-tRNA synthetase alpha chain
MSKHLSQTQLAHALSIPDLTDALLSEHAMQTVIKLAQRALQQTWHCSVQTVRNSPLVPIENNYDRLNYPRDGASRDARYTRYVTDRYILRTQTSSAIPDALAGLNGQPATDLLILAPGLVYRRDCIDRLHCAEPHQLDLWRVIDHRKHKPLTESDLASMIAQVMAAVVPHHEYRTVPSPHPYTTGGVQIDVLWHDEWIEVGECGLVEPKILENAQLKVHSGLAMGLGLDRLLMIRKNIPDIRLLRSQDLRVQEQMNDLSVYRPVSLMPAITRDLSLVMNAQLDVEQIGDRIRTYVNKADVIESIEIAELTTYEQLPQSARERMGMRPEQANVLLRLVIRDMHTTLSAAQANEIRNHVYALLHEGIPVDVAADSIR